MSGGELIVVAGVGVASGLAGGLLGIGGSIVMIPVLTVALGPDQQLYQAAAMVVNVAVALSAAIRHARAGAVRWDAVQGVAPVAVVAVVAGVVLSNQFDGPALQTLFGCFMLLLAGREVVTLVRADPDRPERPERCTRWRFGAAGAAMGVPAGLLGVGGGLILVPMLDRLVRLPLRQAIGTSSAVILVSAGVGAVTKLAGVGAAPGSDGDVSVSTALLLAAILTPGGVVGAVVGASLTHALPERAVRLALFLLLLVAGARMIGIA